MSLPKWPDILEVPDQEDLLGLLIETVAWEEISLAALIHAEAEKVQALVDECADNPSFAEDAVKLNESVRGVLLAAIEKEEKIFRKLRLLIDARRKEREYYKGRSRKKSKSYGRYDEDMQE